MARAVEQHIRIDNLDDLRRYLTKDLGYSKGVAVYMMNQRYLDGQLQLTKVEYVGVKPQGEVPIDPEFGHIELDHDRVRFVPRRMLWRKAIYRIAEGCDVRTIWPRRPPASQPAPDQQEGKAGPDSFKPEAARSFAALPPASSKEPTPLEKGAAKAKPRKPKQLHMHQRYAGDNALVAEAIEGLKSNPPKYPNKWQAALALAPRAEGLDQAPPGGHPAKVFRLNTKIGNALKTSQNIPPQNISKQIK
jgi:hypothetical protein